MNKKGEMIRLLNGIEFIHSFIEESKENLTLIAHCILFY